MDHRPFKDWLLNAQNLSADEQRQLNTHLQGCSSCTALAEVNLTLKSVKMTAPAAGFAERFQLRLETQKKALRRRNFWGFVLLTLSVVGGLAWISRPVLKSMIQSPVDLLGSWFTSILSFWATLQAMGHAGEVLVRVVPGFIPGYIWTIVLFSACGWSLVWVFSLIKFTKLPQGV